MTTYNLSQLEALIKQRHPQTYQTTSGCIIYNSEKETCNWYYTTCGKFANKTGYDEKLNWIEKECSVIYQKIQPILCQYNYTFVTPVYNTLSILEVFIELIIPIQKTDFSWDSWVSVCIYSNKDGV